MIHLLRFVLVMLTAAGMSVVGWQLMLAGFADAWRLSEQSFGLVLPSLVLFSPGLIAVTGPRVSGVLIDPTESSELWNVENFDLAPPSP